MKILLVEDDPSLRLLLQQKLIRYGYTVNSVDSAELGWDLSQKQDFDLLILDWVLPGMSGIELCRRLRARPGGEYLYIWLVTARDSREDLFEVLAAGANDYLAKPIDLPLLEVRLRIAEQQVHNLQQRREAETVLAKYHEKLEQRVVERTEALSQTVNALQAEIQQRSTAEALLGQTRDQLRALASRLLSVQEDQQKRISREIHDELGQAMTALKLDLGWLCQQLQPEQTALQAKIQKMIPLVSDTIRTIQRICAELRPGLLDDLGLVDALEWLLQEFGERTGIQTQFDVLPDELEIPAELATTLFRICQESLTNVMRHAQAQSVHIFLEQNETKIRLEIADNGKGITLDRIEHPTSLGLMGIRERLLPWNGEVSIAGKPGLGTTINVTVALEGNS
jgi:signal transduction histidine kinase